MPRIAPLLTCLCLMLLPTSAVAIGVEQIRKHPEGSDVALVFVHGLGGGPCSSFESDSDNAKPGERTFSCSRFEPGNRLRRGIAPLSWFTIIERDGATVLPGDRTLADVDIYAVSYVDTVRATISATEIGESLARNPEFLRILDNYNHVLFVAHSMGGIVLRRAMVRLQLSPERARLDRVVGVALLGSPSEGSPLADSVMDWGCWIPSFLRKVCWGEYVALWYGAGWHQITDLQTLKGHNHLLAGLQTDWGAVLEVMDGKPLTVSCAYETIPELLALNLTVVERLYTHTAGCREQIPITQKHTGLSKPTDVEDNRHQWLRNAIIKSLKAIEDYKLRVWAAGQPLGPLIDQVVAETEQPPLPGELGEKVTVRDATTAELHALQLKPDNRQHTGPTVGALLKSIARSNPCLKIQPDRRRRTIEVWTENAVACPTPTGEKEAFACDLRNCR